MLADRLQLSGWPISRSGVSKIEGGPIYGPDFRLFYLAHVLAVQLPNLFPTIDLRAPLHDTVLRFISYEKRGLPPELLTAPSFDLSALLSKETLY